MNFIVGSVTTFKGKPPSFDIMYLDPDTMLPVELETYAFDLDTANKNGTTNWNLYIDHRKEYNLPDMSPASYLNLSNSILADKEVCEKYKVNMYVGGPISDRTPCTKEQARDLYCYTTSSDEKEVFKCREDGEPSHHMKWMIDWEKFQMSIISAVNHHWYKSADKSALNQLL